MSCCKKCNAANAKAVGDAVYHAAQDTANALDEVAPGVCVSDVMRGAASALFMLMESQSDSPEHFVSWVETITGAMTSGAKETAALMEREQGATLQ